MAVDSAKQAGILMFCSASDKGGTTEEKSYPGDFGPCIKIGGASDLGDKLTWVNEDWVHYLLPGKRIPFVSPDSMSYETGSSVATACASGLAGTLLYCDRLLGKCHDLKDVEKMKIAFRSLTKGHKGRKFVDVQRNLEGSFLRRIKDLRKRRNLEGLPIPVQNLNFADRIVKQAFSDMLEDLVR